MKLFQNLFMLLILMISFTALATTPTLEKKEKATMEMVKANIEVVNVEAFSDVFYKHSVMQNAEFIFKLNKATKPEIKQALDHDVGWKSLKIINYKEKFYRAKYSTTRIMSHNK
jgi:hypothetical protein